MLGPRLALILSLLVLVGCARSGAMGRPAAWEDPIRWAEDIEAFRELDRKSGSTRGHVVFVGSSSIRLWDSLADDMYSVPVLNRGFGGSQLHDAIHYADDLVLVHEPSLVVVFSGTNDIAGDQAKRPEEVRDLFQRLVTRLRMNDATLPICHIAITPTLARERHIATVHETNRLIRALCDSDPDLEFIDPSRDLVDDLGQPDPQWFQDDLLHLNPRGYEIWTHHVRPVVLARYQSAR